MNPNPSASINDALLDRLVDGELSAAERRELLVALERSPDGWRRCALAFVESQTFDETLGELVAEPSNASPVMRSQLRKERRSAPWWSLAAAVLFAFGLGFATRSLPTTAPMPTVATSEPPLIDLQGTVPNDESLVVWATGDDGARQSINAPLMDADAIQRRFGVQLDAAPPAHVVEEFERRGFQLSTRRRFAPLYVGGRGGVQPIVVPVDDVRVAPIRKVSL